MSASEVAMACATFGLVLGGLIGGPVARYLIRNIPTPGAGSDDHEMPTAFEKPATGRMITSMVLLETIAMIYLFNGEAFLSQLLEGTALITYLCVCTVHWRYFK